ncbi:MAG: iron transporter permease [Rhodospirillales bacterium]|jgi:iron(III) transport system permease protein|nr:iron transporter permease [Rhodospirillales bacterium]
MAEQGFFPGPEAIERAGSALPARRRFRLDLWTLGPFALAGLIALPVLAVLAQLVLPAGEVWRHLAETVLGRYVLNSLLLGAGVGFGTAFLGVTAAWLVTFYRFPGSRIWEWALLLPLTMPAYVIAYTYTGLLDYAGPVQSTLRDAFGWTRDDYWLPPVRSMPGAIMMLVLVLYPYVYMLARASFLSQSVCAIEASRTLGYGPWRTFARVTLPLARPGIIAGVSLALMETLNDFGTVSYFAVDTFTTGIYRAWFGMGEPVAAAQLGATLLIFVAALLLIERRSRGAARYHHTTGRYRTLPTRPLGGLAGIIAAAACLLPVGLGFLLPVAVLGNWAIETWDYVIDARFFMFAGNSFVLAAISAAVAVAVALVLAYAQRRKADPMVSWAVRLASMGYAIPGAVIAVGVLLAFGAFDNAIDGWARSTFGVGTGLIVTGSIAGLVFAYLVRFLAIPVNAADAGFARVTASMDGAARTLGERPGGVLRRVHAPLLAGSALTAGLLVFVDVMKELPATLILRPFNFDTLAIRAYQMASDERLRDAAAPGLLIVLVGIVPVILLSRAIARSRPGQFRE